MTLFWIILATLVGGIASVLLAATVALSVLARFADKMVAFAVGVLLVFALTDILPEAIEAGLDIKQAGWILLAGLAGFFCLEKMALWRHEHSHPHSHHHPQTTAEAPYADKPQITMLVIGSAMHKFVDGVLIAATFLAEPKLGWVTALGVMTHEVPHGISDFMVLLDAGVSRMRALALNAMSGAAMILGGLLGWLALGSVQMVIPYILVLAAASFIYIAIADLVPELHRHYSLKDSALQMALMALGVSVPLVIHALN